MWEGRAATLWEEVIAIKWYLGGTLVPITVSASLKMARETTRPRSSMPAQYLMAAYGWFSKCQSLAYFWFVSISLNVYFFIECRRPVGITLRSRRRIRDSSDSNLRTTSRCNIAMLWLSWMRRLQSIPVYSPTNIGTPFKKATKFCKIKKHLMRMQEILRGSRWKKQRSCTNCKVIWVLKI